MHKPIAVPDESPNRYGRRYVLTVPPTRIMLNPDEWEQAEFILPYVFTRLMDLDYILGFTPMYGEEVIEDVLSRPEVEAVLKTLGAWPSVEMQGDLAQIADEVACALSYAARVLPGAHRSVGKVMVINGFTFIAEVVPKSLMGY